MDDESYRTHKNRAGYDVVGQAASEHILRTLQPRFVISAHTHYTCESVHSDGTPELTISTMNWRNRKVRCLATCVTGRKSQKVLCVQDASFHLISVSKSDIAYRQCHGANEVVVYVLYALAILALALLISRAMCAPCSSPGSRNSFSKKDP